MEPRFPIHPGDRKRHPELPTSVPWSLVAPHEAQALHNHSQSLKRLAERGGLSWCELFAVLTGLSWSQIPSDTLAAYARVLEIAGGQL